MTEKSQTFRSGVVSAGNRCAVRHPAWSDLDLCTADPAATTHDGYGAGAGGEHSSAPIPLRLCTATWLPAREGSAWLSEACAPWRCGPYLRVQVGDLHLFLPADDAQRVLDDLSTLLALARASEEVICDE
jgi:hypothetical protein